MRGIGLVKRTKAIGLEAFRGGTGVGFFECVSVGRPIQTLPDTLVNAAKACRVDPKAVTLSVVPLKGLVVPEGAPMPQVEPLIAVNGDRHVAPASTAKLVTTLAGLERLGANWRWKTFFLADEAPDDEGRVPGLYLKGGGDPTLVVEKFALLVDRIAQTQAYDISRVISW